MYILNEQEHLPNVKDDNITKLCNYASLKKFLIVVVSCTLTIISTNYLYAHFVYENIFSKVIFCFLLSFLNYAIVTYNYGCNPMSYIIYGSIHTTLLLYILFLSVLTNVYV